MRLARGDVGAVQHRTRHVACTRLVSTSRPVALRCVAFQTRPSLSKAELKSAADKYVGTQLLFGASRTDHEGPLLSPAFKAHCSMWEHFLLGSKDVGPHFSMDAEQLHRAWQSQAGAYSAVEPPTEMASAANVETRDVFVMVRGLCKNTGGYLGRRATNATSALVCAARLRLSEEGAVSDAWVHRSGTVEEVQALLKPHAAAAPIRLAQHHWAPHATIYPCTWDASPAYTASILEAADRWCHDVWSKGSLRELFTVAAPDVQLYDGLGLRSAEPAAGVRALADLLVEEAVQYELGSMVPLAMAADANTVFVHWTQSFRHRATGVQRTTSGLALLVFDSAGQVVQVFDFHDPVAEERDLLFVERRPAKVPAAEKRLTTVPATERRIAQVPPVERRLATPMAPMAAAPADPQAAAEQAAAAPSPAAAPQEQQKQGKAGPAEGGSSGGVCGGEDDVLSRQEREWMAF